VNIVVLTLHDLRDYPFTQWIDCTKHRLFVIADEETQKVAASEYRDFSVEYFANYINNGLVERRILEIHAAHGVDAIVSFGEDDVIRAARLREKLGLSGQNLESAEAFRCKVKMKSLLRDSKVKLPAFRRLASPLDLIEFTNEHGLPVYVKPTTSSGSTWGRKISTQAELEKALSADFKARVPFSEFVSDTMVEGFIDGELHHVDGFWNGKSLSLVVASRYLSPSLDLGSMSQSVALTSVMLPPESRLACKLIEATDLVLQSLPSNYAFPFHAEFFVKDEEITFCEIASRTGGARVASTFEQATGFNLNKLAFLSQAGLPYDITRPTLRMSGWTLVCPADTRMLKDPTPCPFEWVTEYRSDAKKGDHSDHRHYSGDKIASAVVTGETTEEVQARAEKFNRWFLESFTDFYDEAHG